MKTTIKILVVALMLGLFGCQKEPIEPTINTIKIVETYYPATEIILVTKLSSWENEEIKQYKPNPSGQLIKTIEYSFIDTTFQVWIQTSTDSNSIQIYVNDEIKVDTIFDIGGYNTLIKLN